MRSTLDKLKKLFDRANGTCAYCRRQTAMPEALSDGTKQPNMSDALRATIDHRIPLSRGGTWQWANIALACSRCNQLKGNMLPADWEVHMRDHPGWWAT